MKQQDNDLTLAYMTGYQKAVEEYRARTCENCKYYETNEYLDASKNVNIVTRCSILWVNKGKYFGCNKFERKEDD